MKVFPSPCQEWGLKVFSNDATSVPVSVRHAAMLEKTLLFKTLRSALGVLQVPIQFNDALFIISGDSGQIPLELWPSWRHEVNVISSVTWHLPSRRIRSEICCQILSSTRRIYLRLPLLTLLDMRPGMYTYLEVHSLDLPRRLERLGVGTSLCLRHPGDALNLRLLLLRRRTLNPSSWTRFTPHKKSPDPPEGVLRG